MFWIGLIVGIVVGLAVAAIGVFVFLAYAASQPGPRF